MNILTPSFRNTVTEGKNKIIFQNEIKGQFDLFFKDDEEGSLSGIYRKNISDKLFVLLSECNIANHYLTSIGSREQKVIALDVLPFSITIYSFITDNLSKKFLLPVETKLKKNLLEMHMNNQFDYVISKEHVLNFGWLDEDKLDAMMNDALRAMDVLSGYFKLINVSLFSVTFKFGKKYKNDGEDYDCLLTDELSLKNINLRFNDLLICSLKERYIKLSEKLSACSKL